MKRTFKSKRGFSLIELMVALGLSSVVIGAGFTMFIASNNAYKSTGEVSALQQSSRAALDIMAGEMAMIGFGLPKQSTDNTELAAAEFYAINQAGSVNSDVGPDTIKFRACLGAVTYVAESFPSAGDQVIKVHNIELPDITGEAQDDFLDTMPIWVVSSTNRTEAEFRLATGTILNLGSVDPEDEVRANLVLDAGSAMIPAGSVILQQPVFVTYQVVNEQLIRCVRDGELEPCDQSVLNRIPTANDPDTDYVLVNGVEDLQFSFLYRNASGFADDWDPANVAHRVNVRGIKIEILMRSTSTDSLLQGDTANLKDTYYLGNRGRNGGVVISGDPLLHSRVQMATTIRLSNLEG